MGLKPAYSDAVVLDDGSVSASKLDPNVLQRRMRSAACSQGGASSNAGAYASLTWDPSQNNTVTLTLACSVAYVSTVTVLGAGVGSSFNLRVFGTGDIDFRNGAAVLAASPSGIFKFDGLAHTISVSFTGTTATITYDGAVVATGTFASVTWASATYFIGAGAASSSQRWPGSIHLVELLDLATPANSARFLMDEPPNENAYINSYPGTTVGNATKNTGAGYPWSCAVVSHDGRGRVWQGLSTFLVTAERGAAVSAGSTLGYGAAGYNVNNGFRLPVAAVLVGISVNTVDDTAATLTMSVNRNGSSAATLALAAASSAHTASTGIVCNAGDRINVSCSAFTSGAANGIVVSMLFASTFGSTL